MITVAFLVFDITLRAGTERAVANVCSALAARPGYRVTILSANSAPGAAPGYPLGPAVAVEHLDLGRINGRGKRYPALIRRCAALVRERGIDILVGTAHGLNCLLPLAGAGAKKVACEHMIFSACPGPAALIRRLVYPRLDAVVLLTEADAAHYTFVPEKKRYVIANIGGFFPPEAAPLTEKRMIAAGRLASEKGFDRLIDMIGSIRSQIPGWTVDIFGAGEEEAPLRARIDALDLGETVRIHPPVEDIRREYMRSSIYLLTSRWEGLPMTLIEAQSCGVPIVSLDCPEGPAAIVTDGRNGFLIKDGDMEAFGRAVCRLAASEELRRQLGDNALADAARFSPERVTERWDALFTALEKGKN